MAQTSNTFRIFVSSTFSDLHAERNALQRFVFPRLRELCLQNGCRFQAIDLRWGVSQEAGRDQKTMQICLEEIKRCQKVTPRPNFIVLLGDRYGWCPLPEEISADEFEKILERVSDDDKKDLLCDEKTPNGWYRLDENAVPPSFCLQPREGKYAEYGVWAEVERKLHAILENATADFDEKTRTKYVASATEQEINQGLEDEKASEHVFCFFRNFANRDKFSADFTEQAGRLFEFDENKQPNEIANRKLDTLKKRLSKDLPKQNVHDYSAQWLENTDSQTPHTTDHLPDDLEDFQKLLDEEPKTANLCVDVWRQLSQVILDEISKIETVPFQRERHEHEKFGDERAKHFVGRTDYLDKIREYVESDNRQPLCLWGESGSGKSALMAYAAKEIKDDLVVRFIGATPQSSDIRSLLENLCRQISDDKPDIPSDYNELIKEFPKRLTLAAKEKQLVLFLDALDQLSEAENAQNLRWLPENLPENVRLIVSTLPDNSLDILRRRLPAENIIELKPMPKNEGGEVLNRWLADKNRTLQDRQRAEILDKFAAKGLPLYLKFAFEEARLWHSYDELKPLATKVEGIIGDLFTRLSEEKNHGATMVKRSLGYLAAARYGLTEDELLDVLSIDEDVMDSFRDRSKKSPEVDSLPVVVWSRLYFDLEPYLTERAGADAVLLSFYHRQLGEVTAQKYLSGDDKKRAHKHLADYFERQDYWHETPEQYRNRVGEFPQSARRANGRKASEFAFQLRQFGDYERLEQIHTNLDFLESKTAAGLVFELAKDFTEALKIIPSERPLRRIIRLLEEALRRDIHFIARHREDYPQALFQCLWNSCWWYDCPQAANHYEEKDGPWSRAGAKLYKLLENWRKQKETETPGFRWICSLRPPPLHLGAAQIAVLKGHKHWVESVAISPDGQQIVSGSWDKTVRIWDMETDEELKVLEGHEKEVKSVAFSSDNRWIVSSSVDKTVRIWDMETGEELKVLKGHLDSVMSAAISADSQRIVSGSFDQTIRVWDIETGEELKVLKGHVWYVTSVAISSNGRRIVSGSYDQTVRVWDMETGEELKVLKGHDDIVMSVAISADSRRIVSGSDDQTVRIWDMDTGEELKVLKGHESKVRSVAISADSRRIVSGSDDKTVRIWDIETGKELKVLKGHKSYVKSIAISSNGRRIVSGSLDFTVRVWDMDTGEESKVLKGHENWIWSVAISSNGRRVVSGSEDKTVRVWDMETGEELKVLKGHDDVVTSVVISADCQRIISSSLDDTVHIWDMETGEQLQTPEDNTENVQAITSPQLFSIRVLLQTIETLIEDKNQNGLAFYSDTFSWMANHPDGKSWAIEVGSYLCIISLEGKVYELTEV